MKKRKGQTIAFEQVLLFMISVAVFIASYALFVMYQNSYLSSIMDDQLIMVNNYISSEIIEVCKSHNYNTSKIIGIPKMIANQPYKIKLTPSGLNVTAATGDYKFTKLYGLDYSFSGSANSDKGKIIIYKKESSIIIQ